VSCQDDGSGVASARGEHGREPVRAEAKGVDSPAVERAVVKLAYYSHRYGGNPENLARAKDRFAELAPKYASLGIILWAPWFVLADAGVREDLVWNFISEAIFLSTRIVIDLDGAPASEGMVAERDEALAWNEEIETLGSEGTLEARDPADAARLLAIASEVNHWANGDADPLDALEAIRKALGAPF
jgi:hypothetical protein